MLECIYLKDNSVLVESGLNDLRCKGRTQPQGLQSGYFVVYISFIYVSGWGRKELDFKRNIDFKRYVKCISANIIDLFTN